MSRKRKIISKRPAGGIVYRGPEYFREFVCQLYMSVADRYNRRNPRIVVASVSTSIPTYFNSFYNSSRTTKSIDDYFRDFDDLFMLAFALRNSGLTDSERNDAARIVAGKMAELDPREVYMVSGEHVMAASYFWPGDSIFLDPLIVLTAMLGIPNHVSSNPLSNLREHMRHELCHNDLGDSLMYQYFRELFDRLAGRYSDVLFNLKSLSDRKDLIEEANIEFETLGQSRVPLDLHIGDVLETEDQIRMFEYLSRKYQHGEDFLNAQYLDAMRKTDIRLLDEVTAHVISDPDSLDMISHHEHISYPDDSPISFDDLSDRVLRFKEKKGVKRTLKVVKEMVDDSWRSYQDTDQRSSVLQFADRLAA